MDRRKIDFLCGWPVSACAMEDQSHEQAHSGRADPVQPQLEEGQIAVSEADDSGDNRGLRNGLGQRLHEIEEGGRQREARDPPIHHGIVAVQISQQRQQDQSDGQWEQEHQHRQRDGDDGVKADVGDQQGKNTEADGPETVFRPIGEHSGEGFGTAGDQTDGGLETRQDHRQCQHHQSGPPQIVLSDDGKGLAAVGAGDGKGVAPGPHDGDGHIDAAHEQTAEDAGEHCVLGDGAGFRDAQSPDDVDDYDAEGQTGQSVHGVVTLQKTGEEGSCSIGRRWRHIGDAVRGVQQGCHHQNGQHQQEQRRQQLPHPRQNLAGTQGEEQHGGEEHAGEHRQQHRGVDILAQQRLDAHGERRGGAAGNGEEGTDGQIQSAGEEDSVSGTHPPGHLLQAVAAADALCGYAQKGDTYAGDQQTDDGGPYIAPGLAAQKNGKNQVSCPEEQAEQHGGDEELLAEGQPIALRFHNTLPQFNCVPV